MTTKIIGLGHKARHGKDYLAGCLLKLLPGSRIFSFADDLKALARALGMTSKHPAFLQQLGAAMRALDENYWVDCVFLKLEELNPPYAIVPDVRFPNEADVLKRHGAFLVKVERFALDGTLYVDPSRPATHESETALDGYTGWNEQVTARSGDLWALDAAAQRIADRILITR